MKAATPALIDFLASGRPFLMADLYTIELISGTVLYYTSFDIDLDYNGRSFSANGPQIRRTGIRCVIGLEVDTMTLSITGRDTDTLSGLTWRQAGCTGLLDDAMITLDRAYIDPEVGLNTVVGALRMFVGFVGPLEVDGQNVDLTANSPIDRLNTMIPGNLYQAGCSNTLFDDNCKLNRDTWDVAGSVGGTPTRLGFSAALGQASGYFDLGMIRFDSGELAGLSRTIKRWDGTALSFLNPLPLAPEINDLFTVWPGCPRTQDVCESRYFNRINYRGQPFIPVPETSV